MSSRIRRWNPADTGQLDVLLDEAAGVVAAGGLVVFPTETVYGLGAAPTDEAAVARLYDAKGRSAGKPIAVLAADATTAARWGRFSPGAARLAQRFWPGGMTLILEPTPQAPPWLARPGIGLRVPDHPFAAGLCRRCGGLIAATSANLADQPPPRTAAELIELFRELVELIVIGEPPSRTGASTVIDARGPEPRLLRQGPIPWKEVLELWR
jgi:L-threonylcarbamoyladenylate synthase